MEHILLVDEHTLFRQSLAYVLEHHGERPVVAQAGTLAEGLQHVEAVDVAVVDRDLPDGSSDDFVRVLRRVSPQTRVVALVPAPNAALTGVKADAVVSKGAGLDELLGMVAQLSAACRRS
jgi:DNA-binding NarL/FixJ family response regulator